MAWFSFLAGCFGIFAVALSLILGHVSPDGSITRKDAPLRYWLIVAVGCTMAGVLLINAWRG